MCVSGIVFPKVISKAVDKWTQIRWYAPITARRIMVNTHEISEMTTLAARLRSKRRQLGWTQERLAEAAGTTQAVIQKIENGKSLRPVVRHG
jgi:ribosome-binding protein aMBF1 (putative translation factor)